MESPPMQAPHSRWEKGFSLLEIMVIIGIIGFYIIVGCFVFGMLLTPPDIISQSLLAIPMWILFEFGVFFGRFIQREERDETTAH